MRAPLLVVLVAAACAPTRNPDPARQHEPTPIARAPEPGPSAEPIGAVTRIGRNAMMRADLIVRGTVLSKEEVGGGAEVERVTVAETLRGPEGLPDEPLTVFSRALGVLPDRGREALFLLSARETSQNLELVDVAPLDDEDGPARLAGFRRYLEIEAVADPAARIEALRTCLREGLHSSSTWTRWNAAREYAALASDLPQTLTHEDRVALEKAIAASPPRAMRQLLEEALGAAPGTSAPVVKVPRGDAPLDEAMSRFERATSSPSERRQAVIDAAVSMGAAAEPLFAKALGDADPSVREAGVAAAGQFRIAALEPRIAAMLTGDSSPVVRRTCIVAAGHLRSKIAVPTLAALAGQQSPAGRDAAFALARIRDEPALTALRRLRLDAASAERIDFLDFLLSERFVEEERLRSDPPR